MLPKVGISACLLGERVRYDGDHRRDPFIADELGAQFEWVAVCPEAEAGFGVPRETLRLEGDVGSPRLLTTGTRIDRTAAMSSWVRRSLAALPDDLCGFILKKGSPSCGPRGVKLFAADDRTAEPRLIAAGLFARAWMDAHPDRPVADEEMLADRAFARSFVERVRDVEAVLRGGPPR